MLPDFLPPTKSLLPQAILHYDLLWLFAIYITVLFLTSTLLRLRFYRDVFLIARHIRYDCPKIFRLIQEHWWALISESVVTRTSIYLGVMVVYIIVSRLVWPQAHARLIDLASFGPGWLVFHLLLIALMLTIDLVLLATVSAINPEQVIADLKWSEGWLSGHVAGVAEWLARRTGWNPLKQYADVETRKKMIELSGLLRSSLPAFIVQLVVRLAVGFALFTAYYLGPYASG